jgi:pimeloyl-ACP methyl ester carboxylesterase
VGGRKAWLIAGSLAALVAATPRGRSALKGALVLGEVLPSPLHPLARFSRPSKVRRLDLPHGRADLYEGRPGAPGVVLVHGANPAGIDDPRVARLAETFCRVGRTVLAPSLVLAERRFDPDDGLRILDAVEELAGRTGPVVVVAFSYGGALAVCALAERPRVQARVRCLATVGTYYDVVHLIEGVTTGNVCVNGALHPWHPPAVAMDQVRPLLSDFLGGRQPEVVEAILANRDPRRTAALLAELPADVRAVLDRVSPAHHVDRIRVPHFALHSRVDPAAPAIESAQLVAAVRRRARARLTLLGSMDHVTPVGTVLGWLRDAPGLLRFASSILRTQERGLLREVGCRTRVYA